MPSVTDDLMPRPPPQWLNKMDAIVKQKRQASPPPLTKISGAEAAKAIFSSSFSDISSTGFDQVEAKRLGITLAMRISVRPDDTGASKRLQFKKLD
jgi:hypothetical protein